MSERPRLDGTETDHDARYRRPDEPTPATALRAPQTAMPAAMQPTTPRVAVYVRVSREDAPATLDAQRAACEEAARSRGHRIGTRATRDGGE